MSYHGTTHTLHAVGLPDRARPSTTGRLWAAVQGHRGRHFLQTSAAGGEILVARIRIGVLLVAATVLLAPGWAAGERRVGLTLFVAGLAYALCVLQVARQPVPGLSLITSALDASFVTAALLAASLASGRHGAPAWIAFDVHLLLIVLASLRFDYRLPLGMGVLAGAEYLGVWATTAPVPGLGPESMVDFARLVLLSTASLLSSALVLRGSSLRDLSTRDPLTGLWNRGAFDERLTQEVRRAHRHHRALALAVIDVDHFKQVNDTFGHAAGDTALREVAKRCRRALRDTDFAARIGGEEFAVLLPETDEAAAVEKLGHILECVAATPIAAMRWGPDPRVTLSGGVAEIRVGMTPAHLMALADDCLYQAKRAGRNRVIAAGQDW